MAPEVRLEMITLMDKSAIISMHIRGESNRKIAKTLGICRNTVNAYVREYERLQESLLACEPDDKEGIRAIAEEIVAEPAYDASSRGFRKYTAEIDALLDRILADEDEKRRTLGPNKQSLSMAQIHGLIVQEGHDIGLTTIQNKINEKRRKAAEAFIAQSYPYGQRFEYDFGDVKLEIDGEVKTLRLAVMTAPASGYRYALLYTNAKFDVFIDSQVRFFEHMGGCFQEGVYDNMRNVVKKFIGRNEKELNPGLVGFAAYYGFAVNVTNCYSGNEKGSVESAVKTIRKEAFATAWRFDSIDDAREHLAAKLAELNADVDVDAERAGLTPRRPPYEVADLRPDSNVDKYSCVFVDGNRYSVPEALVGKKVLTKVYPDEIVVMYARKVVARHSRREKNSGMYLDINHYLDTFRKKPGALANSTALKGYPRLKGVFDAYYRLRPREFVDILRANSDKTLEDAEAALIASATTKPTSASRRAHNAIEAQTLRQIAMIRTIGKEERHAC